MTSTTGHDRTATDSRDSRAPRRDLSRLRAPAGSARRLLVLRRIAIVSGTAAAALAVTSTFAALLARQLGLQSLAAWHEVGVSASGGLAWAGVALRGMARRGARRDRVLSGVVLVVTTLFVIGAGGADRHGPVTRAIGDTLRGALGVGSAAQGVPALVAVVVLLCALGVAVLGIEVRWAEPVFATVLLLGLASLYDRVIGASNVLLRGALRTIPPLSALTASVLAIGGIAASQGRLARVFASQRVDGAIARRLSPVVLLVPALLGVVLARAMRAGIVSLEEGPLLFVLPSAVVGLWVVVVVSSKVERAAAQTREAELRRRDEARVRQALRRRALLDAITVGFSKALDPDDVVRSLAVGPVTSLGVRAIAIQWSGDDAEVGGPTTWDPATRPQARALLQEVVATGGARYLEGRAGIVEALPELVGRLAGEETWVVVPLVAFERRTGALALCVDGIHHFGDEERSLTNDLARRCAEALERARMHARARDLALQLGRGLTPGLSPQIGGFDLAGAHHGTELEGTLGGDWYDAFALDGEHVCVTVGDVEGRGFGAASVMGEVRTALRLAASRSASPAEVLHAVNQALSGRVDRRMVRAAVAVLGPEGEVRLSCAGMPPALRCPAEGPVVEVPNRPSLPLGVHGSATFDDLVFTLTGDEAVLLHTDGVVARRGESLREGLARLRDRLDGAGSEPSTLVALAADLIAGDDEAAVIAVRSSAVDPRTPMRLTVTAPGELATVRRRLRRWLVAGGADDATIDDLVLCATEAIANALDHGGADRDRPARIEACREPEAWVIEVSDSGMWRPDFAHSGGRGMQIMGALTVVDIRSNGMGKTVCMRRPAKPETAARDSARVPTGRAR